MTLSRFHGTPLIADPFPRTVKTACCALFAVICAVSGFGAVRFTATTERTNVTPGEQVVIVAELVVDKSLKGISPPPLGANDAFDVAKTEQHQSSSTSIQIINGRTTQTNEIHYRFFYVIIPKKAGPFTVPALQVTVDDTPYSTRPIAFNVAAEPVSNPDVRVIISLSKQSLYVGEQAILTFKVAQRGNSQIQADRGFSPALDALEKSLGSGFSLSRLFTNQLTQGSEQIGGEMHRTYSLRWSLIPLSAGIAFLPPVPFEYAELRRTKRRDPFDDFFGGGFFGSDVEAIGRVARSNELSVNIKALPVPPAHFSGVVGKASISASVDPSSIPAGEAATLKIAVAAPTRPGNLTDVKVPALTDCEVFTPEKQIVVDTTAPGIVTRKSYKYLLVPAKEGTLDIPPIEISYFDPIDGAYKKASSAPLTLSVTPGKAGAKQRSAHYLTQEEIREIGTDIRYIKTEAALRSVNEKPYREPVFALLYPLPLAIFIFALLYRLQAQRREANADLYIRRRALNQAIKALGHVRKTGSNATADRFLGKISETIERYISQKFGFAATGRTLEELKNELLGRNADAAVVAGLTQFIELLDGYRFGGVSFDEKSRSAILDKASAFLSGLEKAVKKGKKIMASPLSAVLPLALVLLCSAQLFSAPTSLWFEQANRFYTAQHYDSAAAYYEKIVNSGTTASAVYFNLGNTYYRQKKLGLARLYYEKAARLDPADREIAANIKFISSAIVDRIREPERGFIETMLWRLHVLLSLRTQLWLCFSLLFAIAILVSAALFIRGNGRLWLIYVSVLLAVALALSSLSMGIKIHDCEKSAYAILLEPFVDAKNEPEGGKILFTAHEGVKFQIRKTVEGWSLVSLPSGVSGWVENRALGRI